MLLYFHGRSYTSNDVKFNESKFSFLSQPEPKPISFPTHIALPLKSTSPSPSQTHILLHLQAQTPFISHQHAQSLSLQCRHLQRMLHPLLLSLLLIQWLQDQELVLSTLDSLLTATYSGQLSKLSLPLCSSILESPINYAEAQKYQEWRQAVVSEFNALLTNQTQTLVPLLQARNVVAYK